MKNLPIEQVHSCALHPHAYANGVLQPLAYSIADACRVSGIGKTYLYQLINQGKLKTTKLGKRTLIPAESLRRLIAGEV